MNKYDKSLEMWNQYFLTEDILAPIKKETGNETFDRGLKWLVSNAKSVLDFGCGSGTALFLCNNYGRIWGLICRHRQLKMQWKKAGIWKMEISSLSVVEWRN